MKYMEILSCVFVTVKGVGWVIRFIDHSQVVTTAKYNTVADSHTTNHSTLNLLSVISLVFTICLLATDLSQANGNFKSRMKSSWHSLIPFLLLPSTADSLNSDRQL
jgi:hypothetical protein